MKTRLMLGTCILLGSILSSSDLLAQGRGGRGGNPHNRDQWENHPGNQQARGKGHLEESRDYRSEGWHDRGQHHDNTYNNRYKHYYRPPHWSSKRVYQSRPRYIYYRDFNVYYDCYRDIYITLSGRNWSYSRELPMCMHHTNFDRISVSELDFYDDDLPGYVNRRSRGYIQVGARF